RTRCSSTRSGPASALVCAFVTDPLACRRELGGPPGGRPFLAALLRGGWAALCSVNAKSQERGASAGKCGPCVQGDSPCACGRGRGAPCCAGTGRGGRGSAVGRLGESAGQRSRADRAVR